MIIPRLIAGPTIRPNHAIQTPVDLLSIAPTIARILQITPAANWEGTAVEEISIELAWPAPPRRYVRILIGFPGCGQPM